MAKAARDAVFAARKGIPQSVAREFHAADRGTKNLGKAASKARGIAALRQGTS